MPICISQSSIDLAISNSKYNNNNNKICNYPQSKLPIFNPFVYNIYPSIISNSYLSSSSQLVISFYGIRFQPSISMKCQVATNYLFSFNSFNSYYGLVSIPTYILKSLYAQNIVQIPIYIYAIYNSQYSNRVKQVNSNQLFFSNTIYLTIE